MKKLIIFIICLCMTNIKVMGVENDQFVQEDQFILVESSVNLYTQLLKELDLCEYKSDEYKQKLEELNEFKAYIRSLKQYDYEFLKSMRYSDEVIMKIKTAKEYNDELYAVASPTITNYNPTITKSYDSSLDMTYIYVSGGFQYDVVMLGTTTSYHNYGITTVPFKAYLTENVSQAANRRCDTEPQEPYSYSGKIKYWYALPGQNNYYTKNVPSSLITLGKGSFNMGFTSAIDLPNYNTEGHVDSGTYNYIYKVPGTVRTVYYKSGYAYRTSNLNYIWKCLTLLTAIPVMINYRNLKCGN